MTEEITVFHHIPKTAGTTFYSILEQQYAPDERFRIDGMAPSLSLTRFRDLSRSEKDNYSLLYGHLADHFMPFLDRHPLSITFLREPVDHFISSFFYIKRSEYNRYRHVVREFRGIEEYIEFRKHERLDNLQTRHVAGETDFILDPQKMPVDMEVSGADVFSRAQARLEQMEFVLLTEYFDEAVMILHDQLNWKSYPYYRFQNRTKYRPQADAFPLEIIDKIKAVCFWDLKLYQLAKDRFFELYNGMDGRFHSRLRRFVVINRFRNFFSR